jgi:RNA polymerase sigma factor (sigma-70 family)
MAVRPDVVRVSTREPNKAMPDLSDLAFRAEYGKVIAYLCYQGFDRQVAEEAAADAMSEAWRARIGPDRRAGWIRTAAKRIAGRLAKDRRDPQARLRDKGYRPPNADLNGTEAYRAIEQEDELVVAMRQLPEKQRSVMALYLFRLTHKEIAEELGIPTRTVYDLLGKARTHLRSVLEADAKEESP